nr:immunoglobulin heavy chain junction region [Mus musculus]
CVSYGLYAMDYW